MKRKQKVPLLMDHAARRKLIEAPLPTIRTVGGQRWGGTGVSTDDGRQRRFSHSSTAADESYLHDIDRMDAEDEY